MLVSESANCTVLRAVVLTQYQRVIDGHTDGETDGIAIASTALAMRALRLTVRNRFFSITITALHKKCNNTEIQTDKTETVVLSLTQFGLSSKDLYQFRLLPKNIPRPVKLENDKYASGWCAHY